LRGIRFRRHCEREPKAWLRLQMAYDLAQARRHEGDIHVKRVARRKLHEPRA